MKRRQILDLSLCMSVQKGSHAFPFSNSMLPEEPAPSQTVHLEIYVRSPKPVNMDLVDVDGEVFSYGNLQPGQNSLKVANATEAILKCADNAIVQFVRYNTKQGEIVDPTPLAVASAVPKVDRFQQQVNQALNQELRRRGIIPADASVDLYDEENDDFEFVDELEMEFDSDYEELTEEETSPASEPVEAPTEPEAEPAPDESEAEAPNSES